MDFHQLPAASCQFSLEMAQSARQQLLLHVIVSHSWSLRMGTMEALESLEMDWDDTTVVPGGTWWTQHWHLRAFRIFRLRFNMIQHSLVFHHFVWIKLESALKLFNSVSSNSTHGRFQLSAATFPEVQQSLQPKIWNCWWRPNEPAQ